MSKIFTKGNNVVNQLGCSRKVKETFWKQVMLPEDSGKLLKIEANPGQTAVLTDTGRRILDKGDIWWWGWVLNSQTMTKVMNGYRKYPSITALVLYNSFLRKLVLVPTLKPEAEKVPRVKDSFYTDLRLGNAFMVMKGDGGELYGYGDNTFGQCGYNSEGRGVFAEPALVKPGTGVDELTFGTYSVGMQYTLAVDGTLVGNHSQG